MQPALYYPYIHIRSENWLKATLLCVPAVKRIVPSNYAPEDDAAIIPYVTISGPNGLYSKRSQQQQAARWPRNVAS